MSEQWELKPCPFCGGEAEFDEDRCDEGHEHIFIVCKECEARGGWISMEQLHDKKKAIKDWNTRTHPETEGD